MSTTRGPVFLLLIARRAALPLAHPSVTPVLIAA